MWINNNQFVVACDVDGTLVKEATAIEILNGDTITIQNPYSKQSHEYMIHNEHIELLRMYKARGFYIKAWSANGSGHAESVIRALKLDDGTVDEIETKPIKHMDDRKDVAAVIGPRVFIPKKDWEER